MEIYCTSPWIPSEWIRAHGHHPMGIWSQSDFAEDKHPLAAGVCAFAHHVRLLSERAHDSAVVFTTQCDQLRRSFDCSSGHTAERAFLFNIPATHGTPASEQLMADELNRLSRFLVSLGGKWPSSSALENAAVAQRRARSELGAGRTVLKPRAFAETIARFYFDEAAPGFPAPNSSGPKFGKTVRIALLGGPLTQRHWPVLDYIEREGGEVVLLATEPGERHLETPALPEFPSNIEDLCRTLGRVCLSRCIDVFQRPNHRLYEWLDERVRPRQVKGILLWHYVWCDLWRAEAQTLRERFGVPVLPVDVDHGGGTDARTRGRIQAFLESLR